MILNHLNWNPKMHIKRLKVAYLASCSFSNTKNIIIFFVVCFFSNWCWWCLWCTTQIKNIRSIVIILFLIGCRLILTTKYIARGLKVMLGHTRSHHNVTWFFRNPKKLSIKIIIFIYFKIRIILPDTSI